MAAWNIGQLGQESLAKEQEKLLNPIQVTPANKEQNLKEIVRKYQESQYYNYSVFLGELGQLGYCTMPIEMPTILEIVPKNNASEIRACMSYVEHKQRNKRVNDTYEGENGNANKRYKVDDGWSNETGTVTSNNSVTSNANNNKQQRPVQQQETWGDEENTVRRNRSKFDHRKSSNRMQTGWSDEEVEPSRNGGFGEFRNHNNDRNNDRFRDRRGGGGNNNRGFCGRGRARGRGRGGQSNENRYNNNNNNVSSTNENAAASGWSDDESKATTKPAVDNNNMTKVDPIDDWDNPETIIKQDPLPEPTIIAAPTTTETVDDEWN